MKRIFATTFSSQYLHVVLLITRIAIACFMLAHGIPKLDKLTGREPLTFSDPIGIGVLPSLVLAAFAEVFCSLLILIGLATRLAVWPLIITMMAAAFIVRSEDLFTKQELALHYLLTYFLLFVAGGGRYSIDHLISKRIDRVSSIPQ